MTAEILTPSVLKSKSSFIPEATPMTQNAAPTAVRPGKRVTLGTPVIAMETTATAVMHPDGNYSRQCALSAARKRKFPSSPHRADRFTAVIVTEKYDPADN